MGEKRRIERSRTGGGWSGLSETSGNALYWGRMSEKDRGWPAQKKKKLRADGDFAKHLVGRSLVRERAGVARGGLFLLEKREEGRVEKRRISGKS